MQSWLQIEGYFLYNEGYFQKDKTQLSICSQLSMISTE